MAHWPGWTQLGESEKEKPPPKEREKEPMSEEKKAYLKKLKEQKRRLLKESKGDREYLKSVERRKKK